MASPLKTVSTIFTTAEGLVEASVLMLRFLLQWHGTSGFVQQQISLAVWNHPLHLTNPDNFQQLLDRHSCDLSIVDSGVEYPTASHFLSQGNSVDGDLLCIFFKVLLWSSPYLLTTLKIYRCVSLVPADRIAGSSLLDSVR